MSRPDVPGTIEPMPDVVGDFTLTMDELRAVARFVTECAQDVLPVFEDAVPEDERPRVAIDAAWQFINGAKRTRLQRVASLDAHRAAAEAGYRGSASGCAFRRRCRIGCLPSSDRAGRPGGPYLAGGRECCAGCRAGRRERSSSRREFDRASTGPGNAGGDRRPFAVPTSTPQQRPSREADGHAGHRITAGPLTIGPNDTGSERDRPTAPQSRCRTGLDLAAVGRRSRERRSAAQAACRHLRVGGDSSPMSPKSCFPLWPRRTPAVSPLRCGGGRPGRGRGAGARAGHLAISHRSRDGQRSSQGAPR